MNDKIGKCQRAGCTGVICLADVNGIPRECPNRAAPKPEAQAAGVISAELDELILRYGNARCEDGMRGGGPSDESARLYTEISCRALSTPASHDAQQEAVTEHEGEFGLPPLPASAVYWRQRAEFWREQAVSLGWREKRDAANGEAQQPAVVGDAAEAMREAADLLSTVADIHRNNLPLSWRWPLIDELRGFAALTPAATPGDGGSQ